ncbi:MAG: hypothetical protein KAI24_10480 [Planctomycetes bacterium]|nr:hypothetical protein [Planctomycetota bacterium]
MQTSHLFGAAALVVVAAVLVGERHAAGDPATPAAAPVVAPSPAPVGPPEADGHFVLVVEGDRNGLDVTFASRKAAPWAGVPKGFTSNWQLTVLDAADRQLAQVPLDVRPFATDAGSLGKPARVRGCIVVDSKIGMLVNVPRFAEAHAYRFSRTEPRGDVTLLGTVTGDRVRELAGGGR